MVLEFKILVLQDGLLEILRVLLKKVFVDILVISQLLMLNVWL